MTPLFSYAFIGGKMIYEITKRKVKWIKIVIVFLLVFLANPIGTHILGKAALKSGHPVWTNKDKEE